ncbi:hypothetical protein DPEC_G00205130 [Dallia pectoralis]|uniref:Uncharacterized protein n=1 Tax=Dallia pectoralis TaxID=75939 RepID=A0ACC2G4C9_DALPE|nr:hypothetical protein DPEC_G00205130 [Dallia pectoralis]
MSSSRPAAVGGNPWDREGIDPAHIYTSRLRSVYGGCVHVYTDGAKDLITGRTGAAFSEKASGSEVLRRLSDHLDVFTAELIAVLLALQWVEEKVQGGVVVFSDSCTVLKSLQSCSSRSRQDLVLEVLETLGRVVRKGCQVRFAWVPAHVGVEGNEAADRLAKKALGEKEVSLVVKWSKGEAKSFVWGKVMESWQEQWDRGEKGRHLYRVQREVGRKRMLGGGRREGTIYTRLRIGHCRLNGSLHRIGKHPTGMCEYCENEETVEHVLLHCRHYVRERECMRESLRECGILEITLVNLLGGAEVDRRFDILFSFLRDTGLEGRV